MRAARPGGTTALEPWPALVAAIVLIGAVTKGPVYRVWFEIGPPAGDFVDDRRVQVTFAVVYVAGVLAAARVFRGGRGRAVGSFAVVSGAFCAVVLASALWSVDPARTVEQGSLLALGTAAAVALGAVLGVRGVVRAAAIGTQAVVLVGAVAVAAGWRLSQDVNGEWAGIFFNRNSFAGPAAIALMASAFLVPSALRGRSQDRWRSVLAAGSWSVGILLDVVVLAQTRSFTPGLGLLFGGAAVVALLAFKGFRHDVSATPWPVVAVVLALVALWRTLLAVRPHAASIGRSPTLEGRTYIWHVVRGFIADRPLAGYGMNAVWTQGDIHYAFLNSGGGGYDVNEAHNGIYETMLGTGWIGLAALAVLVGLALVIVIRHAGSARGVVAWAPLFFTGFLVGVNLTESYVGANLLPWSLMTMLVAGAAADITTAEVPVRACADVPVLQAH